MEKKKVILAVVLLLIVIIALTLAYSKLFILGVKEIEFSIKVGENIGLNVDTDKLYFGTIPMGGGESNRNIFIQNEKHSLARVNINSYGDKAGWLYVSKNNFFLKKGEGQNIELKIKVPNGAELGSYEGKILIVFTRF